MDIRLYFLIACLCSLPILTGCWLLRIWCVLQKWTFHHVHYKYSFPVGWSPFNLYMFFDIYVLYFYVVPINLFLYRFFPFFFLLKKSSTLSGIYLHLIHHDFFKCGYLKIFIQYGISLYTYKSNFVVLIFVLVVLNN